MRRTVTCDSGVREDVAHFDGQVLLDEFWKVRGHI